MKQRHVVIIGGGISGLATARALEKRISSPLRVTLLEGSDRLGGNIRTVRHNGFTVDAGPDSWVANKPSARRLAEEVGLGPDIIGTQEGFRRVYFLYNGKLVPMPEGLVLGIPTELGPILRSGLFSWDEIARMGLDYFIPKKSTDEDESVASFLSRRLGDAIVDRIAGPLLGGIFAGDANEISVRAAFPQFVESERKYGSLVRAMQAAKKARAGGANDGAKDDAKDSGKDGANERPKEGTEGSAFLSLKGGMSDLVTATAHLLKIADVRKSEPVKKIEALPADDARGRWAVTSPARTYVADDVVLSIPPVQAAPLLTAVDEDFADAYASFIARSTATVFLGYRARQVQHPLDATGFIVPAGERRPILACTWVTSKWEHRAPSGHVLIRLFIGGAHNEGELERDDYGLVALARRQLADIMNITALPVFSRVFRFDHASPQMLVGHADRVRKLRELLEEHPGLYVAANGYQGTGIPDCIKQGEEVASSIGD